MRTEISSEEIYSIEEKERVAYLLENFFKMEYLIGKIKVIKEGESGKFIFVSLLCPFNLNKKYKLDSEVWELYGNLTGLDTDIRSNLKEDDLIYFKPILNSQFYKGFIRIDGESIKKFKNYRSFLQEINIDIKDIVLDGIIALEDEDDVKLWADQQFCDSITSKYEDLLKKISVAEDKLKNIEAKEIEIYKEMQDKESELKKKENLLKKQQIDIEQLVEKLEYFGFKSFKQNIEETNDIIKEFSGKSSEIFYHIKEYLRYNKNLIYSDEIIRRFLIALQSNELIILSGPSGTGKTSIVTAFSDAINGESKIISVKPSWTETEDLIGFYNPIEKNYISTPFLDALVEAKKYPNKLYLICLDEMNLSHVEYYFAEFLSKLEVSEKEAIIELYSIEIYNEILESIKETINLINKESIELKPEELEKWCLNNNKEYPNEILKLKQQINFIEKYPAQFKIPKNVRFVGTINVDQTTKSISPKVIDRSFVIELLKYKDTMLLENTEKNVVSKFIPAKEFNLNVDLLCLNTNLENIKKQLDIINTNYLEHLNCDFNNRTIKQITKYLAYLEKLDMDFEEKEILNDLIMMKILPRINTSFKSKNESKYEKWINLKEKLKNELCGDTKLKLNKMNNSAEEDNIISFWGVY